PPEKNSDTTPAGASLPSNSTASRLSTVSFPAGFTCLHLQATTRSKRSAERQRRTSGSCGQTAAGQAKRPPAQPRRSPPDRRCDPAVGRGPVGVGGLNRRVLQVGTDEREVFFIEGDELARLHGSPRH